MTKGPFRKPLIATGIATLAAILVTVAVGTWIFFSDISDRKKKERAKLFGGGLGAVAGLVVAPYWFAAAIRVRNAKLEKQKEKEE